jgi:hypothetical protein
MFNKSHRSTYRFVFVKVDVLGDNVSEKPELVVSGRTKEFSDSKRENPEHALPRTQSGGIQHLNDMVCSKVIFGLDKLNVVQADSVPGARVRFCRLALVILLSCESAYRKDGEIGHIQSRGR